MPYAAGGPNDIVARLLAQKLQEALGGNFFVEDLPGGGGTIGTGNAANAAPDAYTLLIANQDIIIQPIIRAKVDDEIPIICRIAYIGSHHGPILWQHANRSGWQFRKGHELLNHTARRLHCV